jgi:hypothetical protein
LIISIVADVQLLLSKTSPLTTLTEVADRPQENVSLGPQVREGELVFGVARIFASFNDTFVHVTDLRFV